MKYVDLHCDTLTLGAPNPFFYARKNARVNLKKLKKGGCGAQCFALFCRSARADGWRDTLAYLSAYKQGKTVLEEKGIKPVLTIEDGGNVQGDLSRLKFLLDEGARIVSFTWNDENCMGYPCGSLGGLKAFGKLSAEYLISRGVYPDISHLSDAGALDVFKLADLKRFPVVATHSLARAVCAHERNLTDEQIKKIADLGGAIGVCFYPPFIGRAGIAAHIRHILAVGGEDVLALGSDFDGTPCSLYAGADEIPKFSREMKKAGFSARLMEKMLWKNAERLLFR